MKCAFGVVFLAAALLALGTTPPAKTKRAASAQAKPAAGSAKSPAAHGSSRGRARGRYARRSAGPSYQSHPDAERYQQIQQALADRGYFKGDVNGKWGDDSVDALKRFQADQKLDNDGKINSLTLIGLGLGPKHEGSMIAPPASPSVPAPTTPAAGSSLPQDAAPPQ